MYKQSLFHHTFEFQTWKLPNAIFPLSLPAVFAPAALAATPIATAAADILTPSAAAAATLTIAATTPAATAMPTTAHIP